MILCQITPTMRDLFLDSLTLEDGTNRLFRNVSIWLPINAACLSRGTKIPRPIIFIFHWGNVFRYINIRRSIAFMKETLGYGSIVKHFFAFIVPWWNADGHEIFEVSLYLMNKSLNYSFSVRFSLLACSSESRMSTEIQKHTGTTQLHKKKKNTPLNVSIDPSPYRIICRV